MNLLKKISPNIKELFLPVILFLSMLSLYFFTVSLGYKQISKELDALRNVKADNAVLSDKLDTLQSVDKNIFDKTNATVVALPDQNSAFWLISQLKSLTADNASTVSAIKMESGQAIIGSDISGANFTVNVSGENESEALNILEGIALIAPITNITKVTISKNFQGTFSQIQMDVYWSALPSKLPDIKMPIKNLTAEEKSELDAISSLKRPNLIEAKPAPPSDRDNPFN